MNPLGRRRNIAPLAPFPSISSSEGDASVDGYRQFERAGREGGLDLADPCAADLRDGRTIEGTDGNHACAGPGQEDRIGGVEIETPEALLPNIEPEIPTEIPENREIEREIEPWPETEPEPQGVRRMLFGDPEPQCTEAGTQIEPQPTEQIQELEGSDDEDEEDEEDELEFRRSWTAPARYNNYSGGNAIGLGPL